MNILITGSNGFLGKNVVDQLLAAGAEPAQLRCLVRQGSSLNGLDPDKVEVFRGSLDDESILPKLLAGIDTVVHLAASLRGSPMGMFAETVVSTEKLVNAINKSPVSRVIFCSSFSVYGVSQLKSGAVFDEECPIEPNPTKRDAYAWCKYYQERWIREKLDGADLVVVRPGVIYGEGKGLLSPRVGMSIPGMPFFLKIGGSAAVPLSHVRNCADLIAKVTIQSGVKSGVFNAVDDDCPSQREYLKLYQEKFGKIPYKIPMPYFLFLFASYCYDLLHQFSNGNFPAIFSPYKTKSTYRRFIFSNEKAKSELGWKPQVSLEEGLEESARFVR